MYKAIYLWANSLLILTSGFQIYTSDEVGALAKIRTLVKDSLYREYMRTDDYLISFLRVSGLDLDEAEERIEKTSKWRLDHHIDGIIDEDIPGERDMPFDANAVDKEGRPITSIKINQWDVRKLVLNGNAAEAYRAGIKMTEVVYCRIRHLAETHSSINQSITQTTGLIDLNGYSWRAHACSECISVFTRMMTDIEANYPLFGANIFFINSPRIFEVAITIIKAFMEDSTKHIVHTFGYDKEEYITELLKYIPESELRKVFGKVNEGLINHVIANQQSTKKHHYHNSHNRLSDEVQEKNEKKLQKNTKIIKSNVSDRFRQSKILIQVILLTCTFIQRCFG